MHFYGNTNDGAFCRKAVYCGEFQCFWKRHPIWMYSIRILLHIPLILQSIALFDQPMYNSGGWILLLSAMSMILSVLLSEHFVFIMFSVCFLNFVAGRNVVSFLFFPPILGVSVFRLFFFHSTVYIVAPTQKVRKTLQVKYFLEFWFSSRTCVNGELSPEHSWGLLPLDYLFSFIYLLCVLFWLNAAPSISPLRRSAHRWRAPSENCRRSWSPFAQNCVPGTVWQCFLPVRLPGAH